MYWWYSVILGQKQIQRKHGKVHVENHITVRWMNVMLMRSSITDVHLYGARQGIMPSSCINILIWVQS